MSAEQKASRTSLSRKKTVIRSEPEKAHLGNDGNRVGKKASAFAVERKKLVEHWSEIAARLPNDLSPHHRGFVRDYFRAQLRIAKGQIKKARRIFKGLEKKPGYLGNESQPGFEEQNEELLAAIDIAARGKTNRKDFRGDPIEPLFKL